VGKFGPKKRKNFPRTSPLRPKPLLNPSKTKELPKNFPRMEGGLKPLRDFKKKELKGGKRCIP